MEIILRGRPALTEFEDFHGFVDAQPHMRFEGPYRNPEDLAAIYSDVHFAWAIDFFEEGKNSQWLLPNRIYEGCLHGAIPIALAGTETAAFTQKHGIGIVIPDIGQSTLAEQDWRTDAGRCAGACGRSRGGGSRPFRLWRGRLPHIRQAPEAALRCRLNDDGGRMTNDTAPVAEAFGKCLIVVPTLNEARHIAALLDLLIVEADAMGATIVVADGGSNDGTPAIAGGYAGTPRQCVSHPQSQAHPERGD